MCQLKVKFKGVDFTPKPTSGLPRQRRSMWTISLVKEKVEFDLRVLVHSTLTYSSFISTSTNTNCTPLQLLLIAVATGFLSSLCPYIYPSIYLSIYISIYLPFTYLSTMYLSISTALDHWGCCHLHPSLSSSLCGEICFIVHLYMLQMLHQ